jgi:hypothetical protein
MDDTTDNNEVVLDSATKPPIIKEAGQPMTRSRLKTHARNNIILLILGSVALIIFLIIFGPFLLINLSLLLGNMQDESSQAAITENEAQSFVPKPILTQPKKATKESKITIKGTAQNAKTIELYVNDSLSEKESISGDEFSFSDVSLKDGENRIKARAINGKNKSDFSESVRVAYRQKAPEIEIETPRDGDSFSGGVSLLKVKGKTAPYARVTINGALAIIDDEGIFRYDYRMQGGENKLMIVATDDAENKTDKEVKFNYSP